MMHGEINQPNHNYINPDSLPDKNLYLNKSQRRVLLLAAAVSSGSGLAVELLLGNLASYLTGNQALAYGISVGGFLAAMGLGSYLTQYIATISQGQQLQRELLLAVTCVELAIAPLTAILPLGLFALFVSDGAMLWQALFIVTIILGTLAGMEVPIMVRILELSDNMRQAIAGVLALDYLGGLVGSLGFPLLFLPWLGMFPTAFVLGAFPALMVSMMGRLFPKIRRLGYIGLILGILLLAAAPITIPFSNNLENNLYNAPVIKRVQSRFQRIVLTRKGQDVRLFLDGDLQFSTIDEYRYHEALVHPAMSATPNHQNVLVLGAGDGMAVREILKWQDVKKVTLIELDPEMIKIATRYPQIASTNAHSLQDPRVQVINADAFTTAPELPDIYNVIIADFPDPDRDNLAKLYSEGFYRRLITRLADDGILVTQASSPFFTPKVISCINTTIAATGLKTHPYVIDVPSFGVWGYVLASRHQLDPSQLQLQVPTRYLTTSLLQHIFDLPKDIQLVQTQVNRLSQPVIVRYQMQTRT